MEHQFSSIRWITFDAVGTLIFADPPVHLAYYRVAQKYGSVLTPGEVRKRFDSVFAARRSGVEVSDATEAEGEREFWRSVVGEVLPDVRAPETCFEELFAHFANPDSWQCFADVDETLNELTSRGYRLAIASNFDARLHRICDGLAELSSIRLRIISSEVGAGKPDPSFYETVLSVCQCQAGELLMIGDDFENDVAAPGRLGIEAWFLSRGGVMRGDETLCSLSEIPDRLPVSPRPG